ncbi:calcium-translocating P-type ATPase, PMCA-type, partial [bacterium]|nr:calcium-translocating P-type ATPase, PMCA-type [bacterium]
PIKIFFLQFKSPLILILIVAAAISFFINYHRGEGYVDSVLIIIIVLASGIAGFVQDYKAEEAIEALKKMASPKAKVIRGEKEMEIKASNIVPGDLILLEGGDIVPADSKIIEGKAEVDESVLTGESRSIHKKENDDIYSSCSILSGRIIAEVYATAMKTKVGKIAEKMQDIKEDETPFQRHMKKFSNKLVLGTGFIIILTFMAGANKFGFLETGLIAVSLAVAAIPEGLPAVITLALSLGAKNMVAKNALIRKLSITESIGSINTICTDKTGTLTEGNMKVKDVWCPGNNNTIKTLSYQCSYYCNNAKKIYKEGEKKWTGDETDIALKKYSSKNIKTEGERKGEISFTSERKMMSVMQKLEGKNIIFTKGAPEIIIEKCQFVAKSEKNKILSKKEKKEILEKNKELAKKGFRILALAFKENKELSEDKLVFISLIYLNDPVRAEAKKSVRECQAAGIRTIMITGDNPLTAQAIANEVNIMSDKVYIGKDLDKMRGAEIDKILAGNNNIFARTSPFHKLRILTSLKNQGQVVAMTGDGVNDALALKKSDVGVAMGIKGTEVSKQASDIILLDDNFSTIRNSILEGRRIFDNIRKFVNYLLTCNLAEVIVILVATLTLPFVALYPVQILWINLITDGLVALALSIDPAKPNIMKRSPRGKNEGIINKKLGLLIVVNGVIMSIVLLAMFFSAIKLGEETARTMLFTGFILDEFVRLGLIKYNENLKSIKDWFLNKFLIFSLLFSLSLQLMVIYTPLGNYFNIVPLGVKEWLILISFTLLGLLLGIIATKTINKFVK